MLLEPNDDDETLKTMQALEKLQGVFSWLLVSPATRHNDSVASGIQTRVWSPKGTGSGR
jgi:hypothetical protein